jgi:hypothetical protein
MGDVIHFPASSGLQEQPASSISVERPGEVRRSAERVWIRKAIAAVRTFRNMEDVKQAARNLTEMLQEAKERGITKAEIARRIWTRDQENPSKRFDKLTVPRDGLPTDDRIRRLQRRTSHYDKVAVALGESVPEWSPDDALVRVFRKTSVARELDAIIDGRGARADDPDYSWFHLAEMLDSLSRSVSQKANLDGYLQIIAHMGGRFDLAEGKIEAASGSNNRLLPHGPLADNFEIVEHFPPIPSVPIFDELLVPAFRHPLTIISVDSQITTTVEVEARVWREIRLAIGPVNTVDRVGPLFEVRTRLELADGDKPIELLKPWLYLDFPDEVTIRIDGLEFRTTIDFSSRDLEWRELLMWRGRIIGATSAVPLRADLQPEHNYAAWRSVTPELCAELFNRSIWNDVTSVFGVYFHNTKKGSTLAPENTLGAILENALQSSEEPTLASSLLDEAKRLVTLVDEERKRRISEAIKLNDDAMNRWS